jgi:hypothetical protein|tara:strand:+ start:1379 stop:1624 length:246 start_codon:yes stop_codon:yes gene_type:complete
MSRFQVEEIARKKREREEQKESAIKRALDYMERKPDAPRSRVAKYAGVADSVLERWGVELPKPITAKQRIKKSPWSKGHMV